MTKKDLNKAIIEFNQKVHLGLEGKALITLDETEINQFLNWALKKKQDFRKFLDPPLLTSKEALELLSTHKEKNKLRVHSIDSGGGFMMGCDIDLKTIKEYFGKSEHICLSGLNMRGIGHGVAFFHPKTNRYVFLKTDENKLKDIHTKRKIK